MDKSKMITREDLANWGMVVQPSGSMAKLPDYVSNLLLARRYRKIKSMNVYGDKVKILFSSRKWFATEAHCLVAHDFKNVTWGVKHRERPLFGQKTLYGLSMELRRDDDRTIKVMRVINWE